MRANDRLLRTFVIVARAGSLRHAAVRLGVTQPALSKQISALEATVGAELFSRTGRGMTLTPAGATLAEEAGRAYEALDRAVQATSDVGSSPRGSVTIATINTLAVYILPAVVQDLRSEFPQFMLSVSMASSPDVVERVERGIADIGLVYDSAVDTDALAVKRLHHEEFGAYMLGPLRGTGEPIPVQSLAQHRLILPPRPYALRKIVERTLPGPLDVAFECNSVTLALEVAAMAVGTAILPLLLPSAWVEARGLVRYRIGDGQMRRQIAAICLPSARPRRGVKAALEIIEKAAERVERETG
jgi:LysR family nitrogen assimilation transcriptional regulator